MLLHPNFRYRGIPFTKENVLEMAYSLVKEGREHERSIGEFLFDWLDASDTIVVHTSGSTGTPKKIHLPKEKMLNSALATADHFHLEPGNTALLCLPASYIAGKMMLVRAMVLGLDLDMVTPSSNPLEQNMESYDFCAMVPLQVKNSLDRLNAIGQLIIGGAPVDTQLQDDLQDLHVRCYETYGMTETITHIAIRPLNGTSGDSSRFRALKQVHFSKDERGCLVIHAPQLNDAAVVTNDVVDLFSEQEFTWLGRYDNVINSGGVKLNPEAIEAKIVPLISERFFITGIPDAQLGQKLILIVEGIRDTNTMLSQIKKSGLLEKFEIPKAIFTVPKFQETESGKIQRDKTRNFIQR